MKKKLYRSRHDRWLTGVVGGLAQYLGMNSLVLRLIFIAACFFTIGVAIAAYIACWLLIPDEYDSSIGLDKVRETVDKARQRHQQ